MTVFLGTNKDQATQSSTIVLPDLQDNKDTFPYQSQEVTWNQVTLSAKLAFTTSFGNPIPSHLVLTLASHLYLLYKVNVSIIALNIFLVKKIFMNHSPPFLILYSNTERR